MKHLLRSILVALLLHIGAPSGHGSDFSADSTRFGTTVVGFYFGASSSHFTSGSGTTWNSRYGPDFGSAVTIHLTDLVALQTELAYVSKGARWEGWSYGPAGDIRLGYVQLAVLARLNQPLSRYRDEYNFRPKLLAGFAFNTKVHTSTRGTNPPDFQDTELSFIFGGGFDHRVWGNKCVTADFRFDVGLNKIYGDWNNVTAHFLLGMTL